jgi:hypothetical protein
VDQVNPLSWRQMAACQASQENNMTEYDGVEFCAYCLDERNDKQSCCQENHFLEFNDLDEKTQEYLKESK